MYKRKKATVSLCSIYREHRGYAQVPLHKAVVKERWPFMANKEFSHEQANRLVHDSPPHFLNTLFTHFISSPFPLLPLFSTLSHKLIG